MKKAYYSVYGLALESEVEMQELLQISELEFNRYDEEKKVYIKISDIPTNIKEEINKGTVHYFSKEECWFIIKDIAIFRILNGKEIYVENIGGNHNDIKAFLLGSAFGCLLIQRDTLVIHGGIILINGMGVIITGHMGAGKSTLISGLIDKGYPFLADDVSVLSVYDDKIIGSPAYPQRKLCRDAALKFGFDLKKLIKIDGDRDKYAIREMNKFIRNSQEIKYIFEIAIRDDDKTNVDIISVKGSEKIKRIVMNIYRSGIAQTVGIKKQYLKNMISFASQIKYYEILRPKNIFSIDEQINKLKEIIV